MNASGLIWLTAFPVVAGCVALELLAGAKRAAADDSGDAVEAGVRAHGWAYYLLLASYGMVALLCGQLAWALHKIDSPRIDDGGVAWLGEGFGRIGFSVDAAGLTVIGSTVIFGLVALLVWTQVGTRLREKTLTLLALASVALGLSALMASTRSVFAPVAAWALLSYARVRVYGDHGGAGGSRSRSCAAQLVCEGLSMLCVVLSVASLMAFAGAGDLLLLRVESLEILRASVGRVALSEVSVGLWIGALFFAWVGLFVGRGAELADRRAESRPGGLGAGVAAGDAQRVQVVGSWLLLLLPWFALSLRMGKLFALAPIIMASLSVMVPVFVLVSLLRASDASVGPQDSASPKANALAARAAVRGEAVVVAGVFELVGVATVVASFAMGSVWGALLSLWAFGSIALLRTVFVDGGPEGQGDTWISPQRAPLWLASIGGAALGLPALGDLFMYCIGHDSIASSAVNYVLVILWSGVLATSAWLIGRVVCIGEGSSARTKGAWVVLSGLCLALTWPPELGGLFVPHESLALGLVYGSFADSAVDFHVGLRPQFLDAAGSPLALPRALCLLWPPCLLLVSYRLGVRSGRGPEHGAGGLGDLARQMAELASKLTSAPLRLGTMFAQLTAALGTVLADQLPARASELIGDQTRTLRAWRASWGVRLWGSAHGRLEGPIVRWALLFVLLFGWLYFKPSVSSLLPNEYHSFGGLKPALRRPADPSRERHMAAKAARDAALEAAGQSSEPQIERIERPGALQPEVPLE